MADPTIDAIISQALSIAEQQSQDVREYTSEAQVAAQNILMVQAPAIVPGPTRYDAAHFGGTFEPRVYIPQKADSVQFKTEYDRLYEQLMAMAANQIAAFLATYFPLNEDAYPEAVAWLVRAITVGGTGLSPAIEAQIWQRGRDRIVVDGLRAEAQALEAFAARGLSQPGGALAGALQEIRRDSLAKNSEFSRDVAIKAAEIELENVRFAVEQALKLRLAAVNAAVDYIKALMSAPEIALRYATALPNLQSNLIQAAGSFYRARLERDDLAMRAAISNQDLAVRWTQIINDASVRSTDARVRAAVGAATAAGDTAAGALGSINAIVNRAEQV